jgi:hypothetical protein
MKARKVICFKTVRLHFLGSTEKTDVNDRS